MGMILSYAIAVIFTELFLFLIYSKMYVKNILKKSIAEIEDMENEDWKVEIVSTKYKKNILSSKSIIKIHFVYAESHKMTNEIEYIISATDWYY